MTLNKSKLVSTTPVSRLVSRSTAILMAFCTTVAVFAAVMVLRVLVVVLR